MLFGRGKSHDVYWATDPPTTIHTPPQMKINLNIDLNIEFFKKGINLHFFGSPEQACYVDLKRSITVTFLKCYQTKILWYSNIDAS